MLETKLNLRNGISVILRKLQKEDLDDIWTIFNQVVQEKKYIPVINPVTSRFEKENWYYRQKEEDNVVVVSEVDQVVVGQCMIEHIGWDAAAHVGELGIILTPSFRNMGIGRLLIEAALKGALEKGFEKVVLSCFHTNIRALSLYKSMGFRKLGVRDQQFRLDGKNYDEILMELFIKEYKFEE